MRDHPCTPDRVSRRHGFITLDMILGFSLVAAMLATVVIIGSQSRRADKVMAERREVIRDLELLAAGAAVDRAVHVERLETEAPSGYVWVQLEAQAGDRVESLVTLLPEGTLP